MRCSPFVICKKKKSRNQPPSPWEKRTRNECENMTIWLQYVYSLDLNDIIKEIKSSLNCWDCLWKEALKIDYNGRCFCEMIRQFH